MVLYLKLVTGEDIVAEVEDSDPDFYYVTVPIRVHTINTEAGAVMRASKWIPFIPDKTFQIDARNVIVVAEANQEVIEYYHSVVNKLESLDGYELDEEVDAYHKSIGNNNKSEVNG